MKTRLLILLAIVALVSVSACRNGANGEKPPANGESADSSSGASLGVADAINSTDNGGPLKRATVNGQVMGIPNVADLSGNAPITQEVNDAVSGKLLTSGKGRAKAALVSDGGHRPCVQGFLPDEKDYFCGER